MNTLRESWQAGRGLPGALVIDGHLHFHAWPHGENFPSFAAAAAGAIELLNAHGVDAGCILGGGGFECGDDYRVGNDELLAFCQTNPERLIGFAHVNPNDTEAGVQAELDRVRSLGFHCFKLLNSYQQGYPGDGPNLMRLYRFAADHNFLVLNHWWPENVLDRIAREFPSVNFITGHFCNGPVLERPNVYCNLWGLFPLNVLQDAVHRYGAEKYLLGSDGFMNPLSVGLGLVLHLDVPDADQRRILGLNQAKLLAAVGALPPALARKARLRS